jgi:cysteine desulfurase
VRAYLDHASTSPLRPAGAAALVEWLGAADPGRVHTEGRMARAALEDARERLAVLFGTRPRQVILTSGATESVHAAVFGALAGVVGATGTAVRPRSREVEPRLVVPAVEHSCVRESSQRAGAVTWVGVDAEGSVDLDAIVEAIGAIGAGSALVHCQWANHEVGTVQPVGEVVAACRERGVPVHVDAACAAGHVPVAFDDLGADLMSISAHKMGGPRGVGALLVRRGLRVAPLLVGGAQERARRAGLEDVAGAVAWGAVADELAGVAPHSEAQRAAAQTDRLRRAAVAVEGVVAYGPADPATRLPHILCLGVEGVEPEAVLLGLDQAGVAAHSGSACATEELEPSPVLAAMGAAAERSLRLSVGWSTTDEEVGMAAAALPEVIARLRALGGG